MLFRLPTASSRLRRFLILQDDVEGVNDAGDVTVALSAFCNCRKRLLRWTYPRMVRRMLIRRSAPQPRSRKTPRGGRMTARMILQISL
jgi:hypothetical protein